MILFVIIVFWHGWHNTAQDGLELTNPWAEPPGAEIIDMCHQNRVCFDLHLYCDEFVVALRIPFIISTTDDSEDF